MTMHRGLTAVLLLVAGAAILVAVAAWPLGVQSGKVSPAILVAFFWAVALVAMLAHFLSQGGDALTRYRLRHKPLAGPRPGADLPG
jgi:hypothetical protein